jgi:predicted CopG family antitoxin
MAIIQVKNVPDSLYNRLKRRAKKADKTLSDIILEAIEKDLKRSEWRERFAKRPSSDLGVSAASLLEEERRERDNELPK